MSAKVRRLKKDLAPHIGLLAICCLGLLLLIVGGLVPAGKRIQAVRGEIADLQAEGRKQETLQPLLAKVVAMSETEPAVELPVPVRQPISLADLSELPRLAAAVAEEAGMELIQARPHPPGSRSGEEGVRVDLRLQGETERVQTLFMKLGALPALRRLETFTIRAGEAGNEILISLLIEIE